MKIKIFIYCLTVFLSVTAYADTSDYIWNEQFSKKIIEAEAGKARSQYDVGNMYLKGQGTGINESKAFGWFTKAAENNYVKAQFKVGFMLLTGKGVKKDYTKAERWLRKAANQDNAPAQYYLAGMYRDGKFLKKDYDKSLFWLRKAKANGFWKAANEYDKVIALAQRNNTTGARAKPQPKPQARQRAPVRPVAADDDLRELLLKGGWLESGKPARYLPSSVTQCRKDGNGLTCASGEDLNGRRGTTTFTYRIVASFKNLTEEGEFTVTYNNNVLSVVPGKAVTIPSDNDEDPPVTIPSPVVQLGPQKTVHNLDCQLVNAKRVSCEKDYGRSIELTRN